jgi:hypothetical protein
MAKSFQIPQRAYDGFGDLIAMGPKVLEQLAKEVTDQKLTLDVDSLSRKLAEAIGFDLDRTARAITTVLVPLSGVRAALDMPPEEFVGLLSAMIERQNEKWHKEHGAEWKGVASSVAALLGPAGYFAQLYKTIRLIADRPTIAQELKILTELRPVYDEDAASVRAVVMTTTLVIQYTEGTVRKSLHLTVDQDDLDVLQKQLDRADIKVQLLEREVSKLGVPLLIPGTH